MGALRDRWWVSSLGGALLLIAIVTAIILLVDNLGSDADIRIAIQFLIYLVLAVGLQAFTGTSGVLTFGYPAFMGLGAYTAGILTTTPVIKETSIPDAPAFLRTAELGFVEATAIAVVVVMVVAFLTGIPILRLSGTAATVATFGLLVIGVAVFTNLDAVTSGARGFTGIPEYTTLYWALGFAALAILVARLTRDSGLGLRLRSSRNDEVAARAAGVRIHRSRLVAWTISAGIAALAGSLFAHFALVAAPRNFYLDLAVLVITMAIIGGFSISGAVIGAGVVSLVSEFLRRAESTGISIGPIDLDEVAGLVNLGVAVLILAVLILRPQGLVGRWEVDEWILFRRSKGKNLPDDRGEPRPDTAANASESDMGGVDREISG